MKLEEIIATEYVHPVFQPVVSLKTGEVYGYEVLTRIENDSCSAKEMSAGCLFSEAEKAGRLWDLEKLCRKKALKASHAFGLRGKLFIKTSAQIVNDPSFTGGYTLKKLGKYNLNPDNIVFELNERLCSSDISALKQLYNHYGEQNFHIAVDNMGLNYTEILCSLNPDYIKIAMNITRGIDADEVKQSLVKSLVQFCASTGTILIAQGIETDRELDCLITLGVPDGQGYYIGRPEAQPCKAGKEASACIFRKAVKKEEIKLPAPVIKKLSVLPAGASRPVGVLCTAGWTASPGSPASDVLAQFQKDLSCSVVVIVTGKGKIEGCVTRARILSSFGSQYGYSLYSRKTIRDIMETEFLCVDSSETVEQAALHATARDEEHMYTPVIVSSKGKYAGIVTIQNLLDSIINVEVRDRTMEITRKNKQLQEHQARAQRDMYMAELVQKSFYPSAAPQTEGWDCAFCFRPASSVSGDVYDFYYSKDGELSGVSLFDVSGHGVASGLIGILAKYVASNVFISESERPLDEVVCDINARLVKEKGSVENYLTGVVLRISGRHVEYINAGHTDVLVKNPDGPGSVSVLGGNDGSFRGHFLGVPDLPCGFLPVHAEADAGTIFLLYTDCLTESRNLAGDELGPERLADILQNAPGNSAKETLAYVLDIFAAFTEAVPLRDDLTVIVLRKK